MIRNNMTSTKMARNKMTSTKTASTKIIVKKSIIVLVLTLVTILPIKSLPGIPGGGGILQAQAQSYPAWDESVVYNRGDRVIYNGSVYEALWYSRYNIPGIDDVWQYIGPGGDPRPTPTPVFDPYALRVSGESRVLTDDQIDACWGGINPQYSPAMAGPRLGQYLRQTEYEILFPRRFGTIGWLMTNPAWIPPEITDYYSYENLNKAMIFLAGLKFRIDYREGATYAYRISVYHKTTKTETLVNIVDEFHGSWLQDRDIISQVADFGSFLADGTENDRKREMAGFLAHIAYETWGGPTAPGGDLSWGLYHNEETGYPGTDLIGYVQDGERDFPPASGKSYHGRGPIMLQYNYNYGLFSSIIYQDKSMLNNPEMIVQDGKLGFMTALAFWMMPQPGRASSHDVMTGGFVPADADVAKGITGGGFGLTINIINGDLEAGLDESDHRIAGRTGFYRRIASEIGADISGEKTDTSGMQPW